jgi:hypothetical protein
LIRDLIIRLKCYFLITFRSKNAHLATAKR